MSNGSDKQVCFPPHARKLLRQVADAIRLKQPDLFDPALCRDYCFEIQLSVAEARALVDLWDLAYARWRKEECRAGFLAWDSAGNLIEGSDDE